MKRYFLILGICFFSFFLFNTRMLNVKALSVIDHKMQLDKFKTGNYEFIYGGVELGNAEIKVKEVVKTLRDNNINFIILVSPYASSKNGFDSFYVLEFSNNTVDVSLSHWSSNYYELTFSSANFLSRANINVERGANSYWDNFIDYVNENHHLPVTEYVPNGNKNIISGWAIHNSIMAIRNTYSSSNMVSYGLFIWDTNMTIKLSSVSGYDGLKFGNNVYTKNSILPSYMDLPDYGKTFYTENYRLNSKDIDRIEYTFDFSNAMNENKMFAHEFNFSTTWISSIARSKLFGAPYLEYKKNGVIYKLPMDEVCISTLDEYSYCDMQINSFIDIQDLKFVVDFNNINNLNGTSEVFIHFDSSLNFTRRVIYINDDDSNYSNYVEVDFTNKYGVFLIPKLLYGSVNQQVYSNLYYLGKDLKINLYDSIDTTKEPVHSEYGDYSVGNMWGKFEYLFNFNNYNQYLFFLNNNYLIDDEIKKVRYDKRYFVHSICSSSESCDKVVNPSTGEEIFIKPPNIENDSTSDNSLFSMFHFFEKPIKFIFDGIGVLYNDYALPIVQKYWYFGFGFTIFIIILKLFF